MLYAHWKEFGEEWCTPEAWKVEFENRGHNVTVYNLYHANGLLNPRTRIRQYSNEGFNSLVADTIKEKSFEIIYVLDYGPYQNLNLNKKVFPNSILIKESGDEPQSHRMHLQTAHQFDIVLSPDKRCVERYRQLGINAYWQPHFADERIFYGHLDIQPSFDLVSTCGPRGEVTTALEKEFGPQFENSRYYNGEAHALQLHKGKIVFQKSQHGEISRRPFEGMGVGRMVMTDRLDPKTGFQDLFIDGQDIVFYDDAKDCIDKAKYYLNHPTEMADIAFNGHCKVHSYHTVKARADELERIIEDFKASKS